MFTLGIFFATGLSELCFKGSLLILSSMTTRNESIHAHVLDADMLFCVITLSTLSVKNLESMIFICVKIFIIRSCIRALDEII